MKRAVVIGLGIFGYHLARTLFENGFEVVAIDKNKDVIQKIRDYSTKAILTDGTDQEIWDDIGLQEDDIAIISFGEDLAAATLITLHLKQKKVKNIIVKAPNEDHKLILEKVGATDVIIPEMDIARKLAKSMISPNVMDYIPLSEDYMIFELAPPNSFLGKTLAELQLRNRFNIEVIAVRDVVADKVNMVPHAGFVVKDGEVLVVIGKEKDISKIK
ncbi:MAG TPA: TrkA family potassium uptake protein [Smithellaceae bacterium]|jgi:trk system potassium uptake protein TrkA|nr:TrkA family potassium uptake protein [Syntrophaceae bacterium]NMC92755.1 TrkA family potassium uptake protein [Smithella sp.]OQC72511.1 MAG: Ktr system potassium uptake protein A [Deltaproteobacteria bacterium ADurb.Bin002]HNV57236.1 TrkA family potassium uptake protein [Smithellaceae bacterium]MBP8665535.1 TrkA family potassium uptake protein [Syntrophaceae bacterium]